MYAHALAARRTSTRWLVNTHLVVAGILFFSYVDASAGSLDPPGNGFVGVYADSEATTPCATVPKDEIGFLYVFATLDGLTERGIQGAGFRIEVTEPEGYVFAFEASDEADVVLGSAIDRTPDDPTDHTGLHIVFPECRAPTRSAGDRVYLGRVVVLNLSGRPTDLLVKRFNPDTDTRRGFRAGPYLQLCPRTPTLRVPMTSCGVDTDGEEVVFRGSINQPECSPERNCTTSCADQPCVEMVARVSPAGHCEGDTIETEFVVTNCSDSKADVRLLVRYEEVAMFAAVPPSETVRFRYREPAQCFDWPHMVAAIASNDECDGSVGVERKLSADCLGACDAPRGCPLAITSSERPGGPGEPSSADVYVVPERHPNLSRPVEDLAGISGRVVTARPDLVELLGIHCWDRNGTSLDLGPDVLCNAVTNAEEGWIDFTVGRPGNRPGASGSLRLLRVEYRARHPMDGDACSQLTLERVRAIDSSGQPIRLCTSSVGPTTCARTECIVWPGDANNDGTIDAEDLETIASWWGSTGRARELPTGCYLYPAEATCWYPPDATYSDAFGDGRVGPEDLLCVALNWGRTHPVDGTRALANTRLGPADKPRAYAEMLDYLVANPEGASANVEAAVRQLIAQLPRRAALHPNIPNPFNPGTRIEFEVANAALVRIGVYDVAGRHVRTLLHAVRPAGRHEVAWDGRGEDGVQLASGVYWAHATIGTQEFSQRMVLLR